MNLIVEEECHVKNTLFYKKPCASVLTPIHMITLNSTHNWVIKVHRTNHYGRVGRKKKHCLKKENTTEGKTNGANPHKTNFNAKTTMQQNRKPQGGE